MKYLLLMFLLVSCTKEPQTFCFECHSDIMGKWTVLHSTEDDVQATIAERIRLINDTLHCIKIECP